MNIVSSLFHGLQYWELDQNLIARIQATWGSDMYYIWYCTWRCSYEKYCMRKFLNCVWVINGRLMVTNLPRNDNKYKRIWSSWHSTDFLSSNDGKFRQTRDRDRVLYRKSDSGIPRNRTVRPVPNSFIHVSVSEFYILRIAHRYMNVELGKLGDRTL